MKIGLGIGIPRQQSSSSGGASFDTDYQALLDAASGDLPSASVQTAQNTLVADLKAAGVWDKLDLLYVFATDGGEDIAIRNWVSPSSFQLVKTGSPVLTPLEGFSGSALDFFDTNWSAAVDGVNYQTNNASIGSYDMTVASGVSFGTRDGANVNDILPRWDNNSRAINGPGNNSAAGSQPGLNVLDRASSTEFTVWQNGALIDTVPNTSQSAPTQTLAILTRKTGPGSYNIGSSHTVAIIYAGASMVAEAADFFTAIDKYMTAIGKNV